MSDLLIGCISLVALLIIFLSGVELGFGMAIIGFLGFAYFKGFEAALNIMATDFLDVFTSYAFTVIPLFVLMGQIALNSGLAEKMYRVARGFVGHVPGGLALTTVVGATFFKAVTGSIVATSAVFSGVAIPEMDKYGYSRQLSTGVVASVGTIGMLIPPSGNMIIFAMITEQSVGKLFVAGIIPGIMIALLFLCVIIGWCTIDPTAGPKSVKISWKQRIRSVPQVLEVLGIFLITIGGLLFGIFTPTEAGAVGSIAVLGLTALRRDIGFKAFCKSVGESLRMACMVLVLIAGSQVLGHLVQLSSIPAVIGEFAIGLSMPGYMIIIMIILIYLVGGSFIDDLAFMILATPIFYPTVMQLGYSPIWFAIIVAITLMIGCIIPPVAMNIFVVKTITGESIGTVYKGAAPFLIALVLSLVLLFAFPGIGTYLPGLLYK